MVSRNLRPWAGPLAVVVTIGSILLATLVSPAFSWQDNALSNLGVVSTAAGTELTVLLFNGGLVAGGLVGLVFCWVLYRRAPNSAGRVVAVALALTLVLMALIGIFPQDRPLHFPVASGFYLGITGTLWTDGGAQLLGGDRRWTLFSGAAGTANLLTWILWGALGAPWGLAVPEIIGAVIFGGWVVVRSHRLVERA